MEGILRSLIALISIEYCFSQGHWLQCKNIIDVDIDNSRPTDDEYLQKDTLQESIELIFEQKFDDAVTIMINDQTLYEKRIKTHQFLGVCDSTFNIDYGSYRKSPKISVILNDKNTCICFR